MNLPSLIDDPSKDDSPNFTDEEVASAIPSASQDDFLRDVLNLISNGASFVKSEKLRRGEHLYARQTFSVANQPDKVLVFRLDWLGGTHV